MNAEQTTSMNFAFAKVGVTAASVNRFPGKFPEACFVADFS